VNIAGATATSYTTPATAISDSGATFSVVVTNTAGTVTSAAATLTVNPAPVAPTITTQPASQTVTAGQTATFAVAAAGTAPLSYQWQKNGVNIAGATATSYTTPATATSDSGSTFSVVVTNTAGTVTSAAATLTVNPAPVAPTITTQPASQTVTAGQAATFAVAASGTAPLSYQWRKNGVNIAGATATSYTTPATAISDSGATFSVVVTNTAGTVTSAAATLTVNPAPVAPTIATQPASQTVTAGQTATFAVAASGTAPLSYQWRKNGVNIAGATATSYTTPATAISDSGATFSVVVTNTAGTVTSAAATLTVNPRSRSTDDHHAASKSDRDRGTDSDVRGGGGRHGTAQLPVAKERREHRRSYGHELHHTGNCDLRQWSGVLCCSDQHRGNSDQRGDNADGEPRSRSTDDHYAASKSDRDRGTDSDVRGDGEWHGTAQLPVAKERREHRRGHVEQLHHTGNLRPPIVGHVHCCRDQHRGNSDQRGGQH